MKIALATNDGKTISVHFGKSEYFMIVTLEEGKVTGKELRNRHAPFQSEIVANPIEPTNETTLPKHNTDHLTDCKVVVARGMGAGMLWFLQNARYRVILTEIADIDRAVNEFIEGRLQNHSEFVQ